MKTILLMGSPCAVPPPNPCFCQAQPNHPLCGGAVGVPIDNGIGFLVLAAIVLVILKDKITKLN